MDEEIRNYLYDVLDDEAVIYDGFDEAVLGVKTNNMRPPQFHFFCSFLL